MENKTKGDKMLVIYLVNSGILFQCGDDKIAKSIYSYTQKIECKDLVYTHTNKGLVVVYTTNDDQKCKVMTNGHYVIEESLN